MNAQKHSEEAGAPPFLTEEDVHRFAEGTHARIYRKLGAHLARRDGVDGVYFAVWAPNADAVSVVVESDSERSGMHALNRFAGSGLWDGFVGGLSRGVTYQFEIISRGGEFKTRKADPVGFRHTAPPGNSAMVWDLEHRWGDGEWMRHRSGRMGLSSPVSIYEVHLGSWRRVPEEQNRSLTYRELAPWLAEHVTELGFTHVEFLPVMEHPFYGSWGYQVTGYFAPTSRYGSPQDLMFLIDYLHQRGIGVILDWVPSHFPDDAHGLALFDGTPLYEHGDPLRGRHPDWDTCLFDYERPEVRSFLTSNAFFWLEAYHADALRFDAVASMLYLDFGRGPGEWTPNRFGGRENPAAVEFMQQLNERIYREFPSAQTVAEESTAWPRVSRPVYLGGLGFGFKWDMGWMHDTLQYLGLDPILRKYHHNEMTFRSVYALSENFVLPLSHDEVAPGKSSLLQKMPGDEWQKYAQLRLLLANLYAQPGKKLVFMGSEFGQRNEWNHDRSLDWHLTAEPLPGGLLRWVADLNRLYRSEPSLHLKDATPDGFSWIDANDADHSTFSWLRMGAAEDDCILVVFNFTPVPRQNFRVGAPSLGVWREILNSDAKAYGGGGHGNFGGVEANPFPCHGREHSLMITLPPLAALFFKK